ncbi:MAG TPA: hypothetical protein VF157_06995, partial [Chloroflexota bacterium]
MKQLGDMEYYSVYEFVADYKDGHLSRREMMRRVLHIAGGVASAASILSLIGLRRRRRPGHFGASGLGPAGQLGRGEAFGGCFRRRFGQTGGLRQRRGLACRVRLRGSQAGRLWLRGR